MYVTPRWGFPLEFCNGAGTRNKLEWCPYQNFKKKCDDLCIRLDTVPALDRRRDRQMIKTDRFGKQYRARSTCIAWWRAIKKRRRKVNYARRAELWARHPIVCEVMLALNRITALIGFLLKFFFVNFSALAWRAATRQLHAHVKYSAWLID